MLLLHSRLRSPHTLLEILQHARDILGHCLLGDKATTIQFSQVDGEPTLEFLLLGPRNHSVPVGRVVCAGDHGHIPGVIEDIHHLELDREISRGLGCGLHQVTIQVCEDGCEEGLANAPVKQERCHPETEEAVTLPQERHDLARELRIILLRELIDRRAHSVVLWIVLLTHLPDHLNEDRFPPIGGLFLGAPMSRSLIGLPIERLEGEFQA